jgi:hypothetical protein
MFEYNLLMAKKKQRRTKKDKIIANLRRQITGNVVSLATKQKPDSKPVMEEGVFTLKRSQRKSAELLTYDPQLIVNDLKKTVIMSTMVLLLELGLWIYLK